MSKKKATSTSTTKPASKPERVRAAAVASPTANPARPTFQVKKPQSWNFAGVGRNDICPCGSGKRFKNCHGH